MRKLALFLLIPMLIAPLRGESRLRGYLKSFALAFTLPQELAQDEANPPLGLVVNRLRLTFSAALSSRVTIESAWDLSPVYSEFSLDGVFPMAMQETAGMDYRAVDFPRRLVPAPEEATAGFALNHNLDRLLLTIRFSGADLFIGRQAVAWGSARMTNPTDIIAPFTFNELDTEDRRGVDALRLRIPLGMMDELDLGWVMGKNFAAANSAFFLRGKFYLLRTDATLIFAAFRNHFLAGIDLALAIGGAGTWLEAAWVKPWAFSALKPGDDDAYFRLATGLDYSLSGNVYLFAEYHFNSAGRDNPAAYPEIVDSPAFRDGWVYLMGRHYITAGTTIQLTPLLPLGFMAIWNLSDGSLTLAPSLEYNVAENVYLVAGVHIGIGKSPLQSPAGPFPRSEFGAWPNLFYTAFRYYF
ncbi:MAG: hypothetical protein RB296_10615 [Acidobacteriota bacterium]|jgi:hypothetical protein|nr:hypothetical protein [Acidobacteriota bacterium]